MRTDLSRRTRLAIVVGALLAAWGCASVGPARPGLSMRHVPGAARAPLPGPVRTIVIDPGRPVQNAYVESFNGRVRDECLHEHWFTTLEEARRPIEVWRQDYNTVRPHSALDNLTPNEFIQKITVGTVVERPGIKPLCVA